MSVQLGTKAETLEFLRTKSIQAKICPSIIFTVEEWRMNSSLYLNMIHRQFRGQSVIVRSSALNEDSVISSMAGVHDSVLDVPADSQEVLSAAISQVIHSYDRVEASRNPHDQVLIQPMVTDVSMSGVVFTQDLNTGGPYYVINYDDISGKTDVVTSGKGDTNRTLLIHRGYLQHLKSPRFKALMQAIAEIESFIPAPGLDIEFAVTKTEDVYIFQVRRLAIRENWNRDLSRKVDTALNQIRTLLKARFRPLHGIVGKQSVFGVMSDWNPIEMIGATPRKLAMSLYRYLITDSIWAEARAAIGYNDLSGRPLMVSLGGRVYIDVRESFNSFLPAGLPPDIGEKLVSFWLETLCSHPEAHDKVEFDVATTVSSFDFDTRVAPVLRDGVLTDDEIEQFAYLLLKITNQIVGEKPDIISTQLTCIARMEERHRRLCEEMSNKDSFLLWFVKMLLDDCKNFGTKPFSILARCAFIAEDFLRSLVRMGFMSAESASAFRGTIKTVVSSFLDAVHDYQEGLIREKDFFQQYGHLRPGTYNILSKRYDQWRNFQQAQIRKPSPIASQGDTDFALSDSEYAAIDRFLETQGYHFNVVRLFEFMKGAIASREYAKLKFTRNVSDALELIAKWGIAVGLNREELSHISITDILNVLQETPLVPLEEYFRTIAKTEQEIYQVSQAIRLPFLITTVSDADVIPLLKSRPNFITQKSVRAPITLVTGQEVEPSNLDNQIVFIESADPGYDWIFMSRIAGLVTKYGGANSHMAIRCAELGIPAAIGCGEQLYVQLIQVSEISLDCGAEFVIPIH